MKICCIADMHGNLNFSIEPCDLLVIAGDICPATTFPFLSAMQQANWLGVEFRYWLGGQPCKECVAIAGNHDWIWDQMPASVPKLNANFHYLCDEAGELLGLKLYGTPQQPIFNHWAFNREPEQLERYYAEIPEGLDILISHCAPFKIMDKVERENFSKHAGSKELKRRIQAVRPRYVIYGHMHGCYGVEEKDGITYVNCSLLDESYKMTKEPIYLEIE